MNNNQPINTRIESYKAIEPHIPRIDKAVLEAITESDGLTCDEVEVRLGLAHQTASSAINRLVEDGHIKDSGNRRKTRRGRPANVYVVGRSAPREPVPCCLFCGQKIKPKKA